MGEVKKLTTLEHEGSAVFTEKKSNFIGYAKPARDENEAIEYVKLIRKKHSDARHNVYAYVIGNTTRYSDDGEPQGTAGMPVLEVIRKSGFTDAVIVVTRYFGGILLGAGGLVRAYTAAAKAAAEAAHIVTYEKFTELRLELSYPDYTRVERILAAFGVIVDNTDFAETVMLHIACHYERTESLIRRITEETSGRCLPEITGDRLDKR